VLDPNCDLKVYLCTVSILLTIKFDILRKLEVQEGIIKTVKMDIWNT
jgi:hypothetical protein